MTAKLAEMATNHHPRRNTRPGNTRIPTPDEIRAARMVAKLTQTQAAAKVLAGSVKAWEQWESSTPSQNRRMPPGLFKLFLITTGQPVPGWLKVDGES